MKQKTNTSRNQKGYTQLLLLLPLFTMAQEGLPGGGNTNDLAPIDDYLPFALLIGIYFAYRFLKSTLTPKQLNN
jgi:hypothetical protein